VGVGALTAFMWSLRWGQYGDLEGASQRIFEDDLPPT
jgi:cbb3-type cytochrome oxidase maturation protein